MVKLGDSTDFFTNGQKFTVVRKRVIAHNTPAGSRLYLGAEAGIGTSTVRGCAVIMIPGYNMRVSETVIAIAA